MALWALMVTDADDSVWNWAPDGQEAIMGPAEAGRTLYTGVELGATVPQMGDTYDGATYTPKTPDDYFVVKDSGGTVIDEGAMYTVGVAGETFTVQKKNGADDADKVGLDEVVKLVPTAVIPLDKMQVTLDTTDGAEDFTVGAWSAGFKGCVAIQLKDAAGVLAQRSFILEVD